MTESKNRFDAFTMGFSTRTIEETLEILRSFEIRQLIDIRTLPGSRRTPQFNLENLQTVLPENGIDYVHMKSLGGLRKPVKGMTANNAWKNEGFRGYADYMQSEGFELALEELIRRIREKVSVYICTEAVFWRCHRQLVSDALLVRGFNAGHIFSSSKVEPHRLTGFAKVKGTNITYPGLGDDV
jgi:uncharacterized protein (DUF488 family)